MRATALEKGENKGKKTISGEKNQKSVLARKPRKARKPPMKWSVETDVPEKSEKERAEKQPVDLTTRMTFKEISLCD